MSKLQITIFVISSVIFIFLIGMKVGEKMEEKRWLNAIELVQTKRQVESGARQ